MKKRILIIDDETIFHYINSKIITVSGVDCEIKTALNGSDALSIMEEFKPDYVFIDLFMSVMGGFEFVEAFKKLNASYDPMLIIMTSSVDKADVEKAKQLGVDHFVTKPLTEEEVKRLLK